MSTLTPEIDAVRDRVFYPGFDFRTDAGRYSAIYAPYVSIAGYEFITTVEYARLQEMERFPSIVDRANLGDDFNFDGWYTSEYRQIRSPEQAFSWYETCLWCALNSSTERVGIFTFPYPTFDGSAIADYVRGRYTPAVAEFEAYLSTCCFGISLSDAAAAEAVVVSQQQRI